MADIIPLLIFLTVILLFALIITYNSLIKYRNMIEEEWSGIDTALKRRTNLIPNLISAVKGYSKYEADTLAEMTRTRGHAEDVEGRSNEESQISKSLGGLIAVAEAYPDLKASENFSVLQQALIEVEQENLQIPLGETVDLYVGLSEPVVDDTVLVVSSSHPGRVAAPGSVSILAGADAATVPVSGLALVSGAVLTMRLPDELGGGTTTTLATVQPPEWTPRLPSGRVSP
jgi:hypothetical protein